MTVDGYSSSPVDISGNPSFSDTAAEYSNGRLNIRFTKEENWGTGANAIADSANNMRLQWAIGEVHDASSCMASLGYHSEKRGSSHLNWFSQHDACGETISFGQSGNTNDDKGCSSDGNNSFWISAADGRVCPVLTFLAVYATLCAILF